MKVTTVEYSQVCELCGQAVEIEGFQINSSDGIKYFCCAGCQSIYQLFEKTGKNFSQKTTHKTENNEEI